MYSATWILNIGTSQLPLTVTLQVNVFGEASFGVLVWDLNGIEVPGPLMVFIRVVFTGDSFGIH